MTKISQDKQREQMALKLSQVYGWCIDELMQMPWADLHDTYNERYLDYIYGV
jgi:hypothetical protein